MIKLKLLLCCEIKYNIKVKDYDKNHLSFILL